MVWTVVVLHWYFVPRSMLFLSRTYFSYTLGKGITCSTPLHPCPISFYIFFCSVRWSLGPLSRQYPRFRRNPSLISFYNYNKACMSYANNHRGSIHTLYCIHLVVILIYRWCRPALSVSGCKQGNQPDTIPSTT